MKKHTRFKLPMKLLLLAAIGTAILAVGVGAALAEQSGLPSGKAQAEAFRAQQMVEARAHAAPKLAHPSPPPPSSPQPRYAGIQDMHQGPFPPSDFVIRNFWQGPVGSDWILVYAGAPGNQGLPGPDTTGQGALRLYTEAANYDSSYLGIFSAPSGDGPLTITAVSGDVLQLRTDSGQTLSFNLQTHQYQ